MAAPQQSLNRRQLLAIGAVSIAGGLGMLALRREFDVLLGNRKRQHEDWLTISYPERLEGRIDNVIRSSVEAREDLRRWFGISLPTLKVDVGDYPTASEGIGYLRLPVEYVEKLSRITPIWHELVHAAGAPGSLFGEGLAEDFEARFAGRGAGANFARAVAEFQEAGSYELPTELMRNKIANVRRIESDKMAPGRYATAASFASYVIDVRFPELPAKTLARNYLALARSAPSEPFRYPEATQRQYLNGRIVAELEAGWYRHLRDRWGLALPPKPAIAQQV